MHTSSNRKSIKKHNLNKTKDNNKSVIGTNNNKKSNNQNDANVHNVSTSQNASLSIKRGLNKKH